MNSLFIFDDETSTISKYCKWRTNTISDVVNAGGLIACDISKTPDFRIINHAFDGHKTTIWWSDNTTTTCYCREDNADVYMGFYIACAKKVFGNNNTINNLAEKWIEKIPKQRAEAKAKAEAIAEREKQIEANKKKRREKNRIRIEAIKLKQEYEAKKLANEKYGVPLNYLK